MEDYLKTRIFGKTKPKFYNNLKDRFIDNSKCLALSTLSGIFYSVSSDAPPSETLKATAIVMLATAGAYQVYRGIRNWRASSSFDFISLNLSEATKNSDLNTKSPSIS